VAALFVLKLEELRGELMDGALGIFHLADVGERGDNADHIAMSIELRHSIAKDPKYFVRGARMTNAQGAIFDRNARAEDDTHGVFFEGKAVAIFREQLDAKIGRGFAGCSPLRDTEHAVSSGVGEFDEAIGAVKDDGDMEVVDESTEALFTLSESLTGFTLLGDVGEGSDDAEEVTLGIELRRRAAENPEGLVGTGMAETYDDFANGRPGTSNDGNGALLLGEFATVLGEGDNAEFKGPFAKDAGIFGESEHVQKGGVDVLEGAVGTMKGDGDVNVADEGAKTFFAFAESFGGATLFGEIGEGDNDAIEFAGRIEFGDSVEEGPDGIGAVGKAPADELTAKRAAGSDDGRDRTEGIGNDGAVLAKRDDAEVVDGFASDLIESEAEKVEDSLVGKEDAVLGVANDDADVEILHEGAETFFAGTEDVFGFLARGDVANHHEGTHAAIEFEEAGGHMANANLTGFGAEVEFDIADVAGLIEAGENRGALGGIDPKVHLTGSLAEGFFAGVAGEPREALVEFEIRTVGIDIDTEGVRTGTESRGERLLGAAKGLFGVEQVVSNVTLPAVGEDETSRRTEDGGGDGKPSKKELFARNGASKEDDEKGQTHRKELGSEEIAGARRRKRERGGLRLLPVDSEEDHGEIGQHPEEVAPTGVVEGGVEGEKIIRIGEGRNQENEGKNERESAEPRGERGTTTKKKTASEQKIAGNVEDEHATEEEVVVGAPAGRRVEEVKIDGDGNDGDLEEVEETNGIEIGGFLLGAGKEDHEDGSGPDKEKNVGGFGDVRGARDKALVIGAEALGNSFDSKGDREEKPNLAWEAGRAKSNTKTAEGGEADGDEEQGVGSKKTHGRGANQFDVEDKQEGQQKRCANGETRKLAGRKHGDSVHQKLEVRSWRLEVTRGIPRCADCARNDGDGREFTVHSLQLTVSEKKKPRTERREEIWVALHGKNPSFPQKTRKGKGTLKFRCEVA
jgi:hypothetical protein